MSESHLLETHLKHLMRVLARRRTRISVIKSSFPSIASAEDDDIGTCVPLNNLPRMLINTCIYGVAGVHNCLEDKVSLSTIYS